MQNNFCQKNLSRIFLFKRRLDIWHRTDNIKFNNGLRDGGGGLALRYFYKATYLLEVSHTGSYLFVCLLLLHILFIYTSNVISFSCFPSENTLFHHPTPCSPIHTLLLSYLDIPLTGASSLLRTNGFSSRWCPTRLSSATYAAGAMGPSMCTLWLMV
jgi:hypothetical protein